MTKQELETQITTLQESIDSGVLPDFAVTDMKAKVKELKAKLKEMEGAKPKPSSQAAPIKRKKGAVPEKKKLYAYLNEIASTFELNLPFHKDITDKEKDRVAHTLAIAACDHFNCLASGKVPEQVQKQTKEWLDKKDAEAYREFKTKGRRAMTEEDKAKVSCGCQKVAGKRAPKDRKPRPKKQFGTQLREGIFRDVKKATNASIKKAGGKSKVDYQSLQKKVYKVESKAKEFLISLAELAGTKSGGTLADKLKQDIRELLEEYKPKE